MYFNYFLLECSSHIGYYSQGIGRDREDLKELCNDTLEIIKIVQAQISAHGDTAAVKFKGLCEDLDRCVRAYFSPPVGFHQRVV